MGANISSMHLQTVRERMLNRKKNRRAPWYVEIAIRFKNTCEEIFWFLLFITLLFEILIYVMLGIAFELVAQVVLILSKLKMLSEETTSMIVRTLKDCLDSF